MPTLFLIPTPVGNLGDITLRALETLKEVDLVLAEDTRVSRKLFSHYEIGTQLQSFHQHNEHKVVDRYVEMLKLGKSIGLISDAGTPGISDPGFLLVRAAVAENIRVEALPGATAFVPALVASGLPCDRFVFEGFLPPKKGRQTRLTELALEKRTIVLYESPHKLVKTLASLGEYFGDDRQVVVAREISKIHEELVRGTAKEVHAHFEQSPPKGEIVLLIAGAPKKT